MKKIKYHDLTPFISVAFLVCTLFSLVFLKMEVRRIGYSLLKKVRIYNQMQDSYRMKSLDYAKFTSPEKLREMALRHLTLKEAKFGQIIHMSGESVAVKQ